MSATKQSSLSPKEECLEIVIGICVAIELATKRLAEISQAVKDGAVSIHDAKVYVQEGEEKFQAMHRAALAFRPGFGKAIAPILEVFDQTRKELDALLS